MTPAPSVNWPPPVSVADAANRCKDLRPRDRPAYEPLLPSDDLDRTEERRVEILKAAGFNTIRTAHNSPTPALLDACDRLGLLVWDEFTDMWDTGKNPQDYSVYFSQWWPQDLTSMILRDRNHASVVIWSLGNEIVEDSNYAPPRTRPLAPKPGARRVQLSQRASEPPARDPGRTGRGLCAEIGVIPEDQRRSG